MTEDIDLILENNWKKPKVIVEALEMLILNANVNIDFFLYKKLC